MLQVPPDLDDQHDLIGSHHRLSGTDIYSLKSIRAGRICNGKQENIGHILIFGTRVRMVVVS